MNKYIWAIQRQIAHFFPFISQIFFEFCWLVESRRAQKKPQKNLEKLIPRQVTPPQSGEICQVAT